MKIADKTSKKSLPIGIIGTGSIGSFVARAIVRGEGEGITLLAVADILPPSKELLEELRSHSVAVVNSFTFLLDFPLKQELCFIPDRENAEGENSFLESSNPVLIM
jgi:hypothetical protein